MKNFTSLLCFSLLSHPIFAEEILNKPEIQQFLETIASAEPSEWETIQKESPCQKLNQLAPHILADSDQSLIHLLKRAILNHDALSKESAEPFTYYYKNYEAPAFFVPEIELTLDVQKDKVVVTSHLLIERNGRLPSLVLDGKSHHVLSVAVNGKTISKNHYKITPNELILKDAPHEEKFTVTIISEIDPFNNLSMEGLYKSGDILTTQCESEGARRIFFTLDRPDVLSRIQTTIIADSKKYPYRLSNGNLVSETTESDGRSKIVWKDPTLKPSYLYACVLGHFGKIEDTFTTRTGRKVQLEVYVEPGKEARAKYSMDALKLSMQFDEQFFDREYDLDHMKMVGVPDFNAGAMENKGLMIFNETALLVDEHTGTDSSFRSVATTVAHEYFHNWSGNRVTVRNWFELALKEAFTDFRAMLFGEWLFGTEFIRPKDVSILKEAQFPEETSKSGHPIMVESYVNARSIYDHTTYIKGREVFRCLQTFLDMKEPEGFRKAQNHYFSHYDGQAVTFRELLSSASEVIQDKKSLEQFERWFNQQGTPLIEIEISSGELIVKQSCPHPQTGALQKPFLIPFSFELVRKDGTVEVPKSNSILTEETHRFDIPDSTDLIPIFMHGYSAPVELHYNYSLDDLACLMSHAQDPYCRWDAGKNYSLMAFKVMLDRLDGKEEKADIRDLLEPYVHALENPQLSLLAKAQLLQIPSLRAISQKLNNYDFVKLKNARNFFLKELGIHCKPTLHALLEKHLPPEKFEPTSEQMQIRELRKAALRILAESDPGMAHRLVVTYKNAKEFDTAFSTFYICTNINSPLRNAVIDDFYEKWKNDKAVFNYWLSAQASGQTCTTTDLKRLMNTPGYDSNNPNHTRAVLRTFTSNLGQFHDAKGEGYAFIVDQILLISRSNAYVAHNLATCAFIDYDQLPPTQKALMSKELKRLQNPIVPPETRNFVKQMLGNSS